MRWEPFEPRSPNAGAGHSADAVKKAVSPGLEWRSWRTTGSQSRESSGPLRVYVVSLRSLRAGMTSLYRIERDRGSKESRQQLAVRREKWPLAFPVKDQDVRPCSAAGKWRR